MTIELNDDEARLLYNILLQEAEEHLSDANTSEAERLYNLATRLERPARQFGA